MENKIGLIGNPVEHSRSPELFQEFFDDFPQESWKYHLWKITDIQNVISQINDVALRGFNITIPHKTSIIPQLQYLSSDALTIQAVNTAISIPNVPLARQLLLERWEKSNPSQSIPTNQNLGLNPSPHHSGSLTDKILVGFNTDVLGFVDLVKETATNNRSNTFVPPKETYAQAVIIGDGGSAKSVQYALKQLQIPFIQYSRRENSRNNVQSMEALATRAPQSNTLWVNTTPVGMHPHTTDMPQVPPSTIHRTDTLIDLIYNPLQTQLMAFFENQGSQTHNGFTMLKSQARHAWKLFRISAEIAAEFQ